MTHGTGRRTDVRFCDNVFHKKDKELTQNEGFLKSGKLHVEKL